MVTSLKEIATFYNGTGFPTSLQGKKEGKYPFYKVGDISKNVQNGDVYLSCCDNYIDDDDLLKIKGVIIPAGSIIFAKIGEALKLNRRAITTQNCLIDNNVIAIKPITEIVDVKYFYYFMKQVDMAVYSSSTTVPSVKKSALENITIDLPIIAIQKDISDKLTILSTAISVKQKQLSYLDDLVKSRFIEMFGDPILNDRKWNTVFLNNITDVRDGTHDSPEYYSEGYPFVTSKNITSDGIDFSTCSLICEKDYLHFNERSCVDNGDILMPMIGTIGGATIVIKDRDFAIKNVALIKFNKNNSIIDRYFILAILNSDSMNTYFDSLKTGGTQKFIGLGSIRKIPIILPPISLQNEFAEFVKQIDKSKFIVRQQIKDLQELLDSKMDEYFG